jgi:DNA-binding GntR family transcriptional regulator
VRTTRANEVYAKLRGDILAGRLRPGQKLAFADLLERYGVSVGAVREALSRLAEQRLVQNTPQHGFSVTAISREDLVDLTSARCEIEALTLRHAVEEGDVAWEADLIASHHRLANTSLVSAEDPGRLSEEWAERHAEFHHVLLEGCSNSVLLNVASQLRDSAELYRRWSVPLNQREPRDIAGEHRRITDAVIARDADLAVELLTFHISHTTEVLLKSLEMD